MTDPLSYLPDAVYILAALLFIVALQRLSNPKTARTGVVWAGTAMLFAVAVTFSVSQANGDGSTTYPLLGRNLPWILLATAIGSVAGWYAARSVKMTAMPQMVAIYNGMGGGAAAGIAAVVLIVGSESTGFQALAIAGGLIGATSFSGSLIAFLKLQEWLRGRPIVFPGQRAINLAVLAFAGASGGLALVYTGSFLLVPFFLFALLYGLLMTLPIGGADMPVVISLYNALTGVAVAMDGFALVNSPAGAAAYAMIVAGTLVGAAGSILTLLMARAMNRSIPSILFSAFGAKEVEGTEAKGQLKPIDADDAAVLMAYARKVVIAPGYGMAVAQAQHKIKELMDVLESKGVIVKFAIHPVAGRMPGHMNVLLAEAGVPYDHLYDRDEIESEFPSTDVALVIGANDVVNPSAHRAGSPLYGMPILDVENAKNVVVLKRGQGKGFAGIENDLFYRDNCRMLYGDAQESANRLVQALKKL